MNSAHTHLASVGALLFLTLLTGCSSQESNTLDHPFDSIITKKFIRGQCEQSVTFTLQKMLDDGRFNATAAFEIAPGEPEFVCRLDITVAPHGVLLDPDAYEQARAKLRASDAELPAERHMEAMIFPDIGKRAMLGFALGPGGGGTTVLFTTSDEKYDVAVDYSQRGREGLPDPGLDRLEVARTVSRAYDDSD